VRVTLVDDHPAVIQQTIKLLPPEFEVVEALDDGSGLLKSVELHQPDIIVLDITLPGENGIELATKLQKSGCEAKIIFLTVHADPDYVREAFAVGASAYVVKPRLASDLAKALDSVSRGKRFISPSAELEDVQFPD
jgi:DNA-binding NarL/FixJ family response regulator